MRIFAYWGAKEILRRVDAPDMIVDAKFGDDQFRGFWWSQGRIFHFSVNLRCRP